jgi:aminobenzoyl-glutamate transport protein
MLPYSATLFVAWTLFLLVYRWIGLPLGIQGAYEYSAG